jgi:hypothetical protein
VGNLNAKSFTINKKKHQEIEEDEILLYLFLGVEGDARA